MMLYVVCFVLTILIANWSIEQFGMVSVGFGLQAPAGVYAAGMAFIFRDLIHESKGRLWAAGAIAIGALLSFLVADPNIALASGAAFLFSESLDFAVYARLRERGLIRAAAASNVVGLVADSALFLFIAFGSLQFLLGQVVGKSWVTIVFLLPYAIWVKKRYVNEAQV